MARKQKSGSDAIRESFIQAVEYPHEVLSEARTHAEESAQAPLVGIPLSKRMLPTYKLQFSIGKSINAAQELGQPLYITKHSRVVAALIPVLEGDALNEEFLSRIEAAFTLKAKAESEKAG